MGQVGRRLYIHVRAEDDARHGDGPQQFLQCRFRGVVHLRAGLAPKVLDDDLLDMPVGIMQVSQRQQGLQTFAARLADAYQDAGGKRHPRCARRGNTVQADLRAFVRRSVMGTAFFAQARRTAFQHQSLGYRHQAQSLKFSLRHHSRVHVRQQPGLVQHRLRHFTQVG